MRIMLATLLAAGLVGCAKEQPPPAAVPAVVVQAPPRPSTPPATAPICGKPADKTAFSVAGLKTQLVVTAISCQAEEKYNDFVRRYRNDLNAQEKTLSGYFSRAYGRSATSQHDDYITNLANQTSQVGLRSGTLFCTRNLAMFDQVMALKNGNDMANFAVAQNFEQPLDVPDCAEQPTPVKAAAPAPAQKTVKK
jgi:hypothetical protein